MSDVTPSDRPKSARNRCVIEVFGGVFVLSIGFRIFCWYRGFCHRIESDLLFSLFTGASSGIGQGTAILFCKLGAEVALVGRNEANLLKTSESCERQNILSKTSYA